MIYIFSYLELCISSFFNCTVKSQKRPTPEVCLSHCPSALLTGVPCGPLFQRLMIPYPVVSVGIIYQFHHLLSFLTLDKLLKLGASAYSFLK